MNKQTGMLKIGVAQANITPWADVQVAGAIGERRQARAVLDPLYARALILDNGTRKLCVISGDLTIVARESSDFIRDQAALRFGFDRDAVIVHMTQTHTAPSLGHFMLDKDFDAVPEEYDWIRGGDRRYTQFAEEKILEAIGEAAKKMTPVRIGMQDAVEGRLAFNRRALSAYRRRSANDPTAQGVLNQPGDIGMPSRKWETAIGPTWIRYLEGPIDPQVLMMCFRDEKANMVASLLNYACHPVHVFPKQLISADWPGAWCDGVRGLFGGQCIPLVLNGCCGNLNPWDIWDANYPSDHARMGRILTERCGSMLEFMEFFADSTLDYESIRLRIPYRPIPPAELAAAKQYLAEHPGIVWTDATHRHTDWAWYQKAMMASIELEQRREGTMDYEIQVFRIGPAALVALPGEPFIEGQLRIKLDSPVYFTFVMHMTSHYVGYVPTRQAFERAGGHETRLSTWSKLAPEALDTIVEAATKSLRRLFADLTPENPKAGA